MIRVAINGYGRIGRVAHRVIINHHKDAVRVVAINAGASTDLAGWMYLLKYDSAYGPLEGHALSVEQSSNQQAGLLGYLVIDTDKIPVYSQKDPSLLPWKDLDVAVVIEATGHLLTTEKATAHITAGAKAVVLSAPAKDETPTYVMAVNSDTYKGETIINNASCTTNCIAPVAKIMADAFGVEKAMMTTIHAYTSDQRLQDGGHKDYRRARSAAVNMVPTSTGAATAAAKAVPSLAGVFGGLAIRVPVATGSLSDMTFVVKKDVTVETVNSAITDAAHGAYKGVLAVTNDPLVSSDIIGSAYSSIVDLSLTQVVGGTMVKVIAWYDNEYGYANRLVEQAVLVGAAKRGGTQ